MKKPLGEEMEFFRQYNEVLFKQLEKKILDLETSNQQLRILADESRLKFENVTDVIFMIGNDFNILSISPSVEKLLGYKAEDFIGRPASDLSHIFTSESFERAIANINKILNGEIISETIYAFVAKDGTLKHVEINGSPLIRDGQYSGMISVARDITERKQAEATLKESENKYRLLADNIHDVVFVMDMNLNYTYLSPSVKILRGYEPEEALKHTPAETMTTSSVDLALSALFEIMEIEKSEHRDVNISRTLQLEMSRKDGTTVWVETTAYFIRDENQRPIGIMGLTRDITERKKVEDELRASELRYQKLSIIDDLTQLYNSRHFYTQLERETERSNRYEQPLTILLLDLDNFKTFNDTYGHVEGDHVLSRLGQVVKRCLRETDSAYRYGGEEFTILLPMTTSEEGIVIAKRIQTELSKEAFSPTLGQEVYVTVSIGLAQYKPKEEMKAFVNRADQFMYQAKKNGRDRIFFELQLQEQFNW